MGLSTLLIKGRHQSALAAYARMAILILETTSCKLDLKREMKGSVMICRCSPYYTQSSKQILITAMCCGH